jgi:hypothetical protein
MAPRIVRTALFVCSFAALAAPGAADAPADYSPVAIGIDKVCTPVTSGTPAEKTIYLTRLIDAFGTPGPWQHSSADDSDRVPGTTAFPAAEFAIVHEATALLAASVAHRAAGGVTQTNAWCFIGGKLARATSDTIVGDQADEYRHTEYFDRDTDSPTVDRVQLLTPPQGKPAPRPKPSAIAVMRYATPFDLPFYNAYAAALAGKLPAFTPPKT